MLLVAPGPASSNKKLLVAPGIATSSKMLLDLETHPLQRHYNYWM